MIKTPHNRGFGPVAQWLEQGTHNPLVVGSTPTGPTQDSVRPDGSKEHTCRLFLTLRPSGPHDPTRLRETTRDTRGASGAQGAERRGTYGRFRESAADQGTSCAPPTNKRDTTRASNPGVDGWLSRSEKAYLTLLAQIVGTARALIASVASDRCGL